MSHRLRCLRSKAACIGIVLVVGLGLATAAWAYFTAIGAARASAIVGSVNPPSGITTQQTGTSVSIGWSAGSLSGGGAVQGYTVSRSDGTIICGVPTPVTGTSCTDPSATTASSAYTVSAVYQTFTASATSGSVMMLTAPTLTAHPSSVSANLSPSFGFDGGGGSGYACALDGGAFASCASPLSDSDLSSGAHTFEVETVDGSSTGPATTFTWTIDRSPPSITARPADPSNTASPSFSFSQTEASYPSECQLDGNGFSPCSSSATYSGLADGTHTFAVEGVSADGATTTVATDTWLVDTTPPTSTVAFPTAGADDNDADFDNGCSAAPFDTAGSICGTASDGGSGVQTVLVSIQQGSGDYWNGSAFASTTADQLTATGTTDWTLAFNAASFPADGTYTIRAYAVDRAGNVQPTATTSTFTIDTTPPAVSLTTTNGAGTTFPGYTNHSVTTFGGACGTASSDISTVTWTVAGATSETGSATCASGAWSAALTTPLSDAGAYTLTATQTDQAGNTGTSGSQALTIDLAPPTSTITFPANGQYYDTINSDTWQAGCSSAICGTASDTGGSGVQAVLVSIQQGTGDYWNGSSFASPTEDKLPATGTTAWSYPLSASALSTQGAYTVRSYAVDNAGNTQTPPATSTFTIDNTPPSIAITGLNGGGLGAILGDVAITSYTGTCGTAAGDLTTVAWSVTDSSGTDQSGTTACTSGSWTATLTSAIMIGSYTLNASQTDQAGNTGAATPDSGSVL